MTVGCTWLQRNALLARALLIVLHAAPVCSCTKKPYVSTRPSKYPPQQQQAVAPQTTAPPAPLPAAEPVEAGAAAFLETGELIVGSSSGLEAWKADGSSNRVISLGPAFHPRRYGRDHVLVLRPIAGDDVRDGAMLDLVTLAHGERRELAELPPFRCAEQTQSRALTVQEPSDFEAHPRDHVACFGFMDAVSGKASVRVRARVDLAKPQVDRWLVLGESDCTPPADVQPGDPMADGTCWGLTPPLRVEPDPRAFPFTFEEEHVRMPAALRGGAKLQLRGYLIEQVSPSERWLLLTGDYTTREPTHRRLLLLDRSTGKLFPLANRAGPWPTPLVAAGAKLQTPIKQAELVANAADVRWLGDSDSELLLLDRVVIRPGGIAFELKDREVAR